MLDILKSEGNFVIKFVALTLKFYLCIAIISKESQKRIIMGVVHYYTQLIVILVLKVLTKCKAHFRCPLLS